MSPYFKDFICKGLTLALILYACLMIATPSHAAECVPIPEGFEDKYKVVTILADQKHVVWYSEKTEKIVITINDCAVYVVENIQTAKLGSTFRFYRDTR